jgi:hypothetical protein
MDITTPRRPSYEVLDDVLYAMLPYGNLADKLDSLTPTETIIDTINNTEETELIDVSKIDVSSIDHVSLSGLTENNVHPISSIGTSGGDQLSTILSNKTDAATIIADINASVEVTKISKTQIQISTITHNELDDRDVADCHPQSAITDLVSDLSTITGDISTNTGDISTLSGAVSTLQSNYNDALHGHADLDTVIWCIKLALDSLYAVTSGWSKPGCYSDWVA